LIANLSRVLQFVLLSGLLAGPLYAQLPNCPAQSLGCPEPVSGTLSSTDCRGGGGYYDFYQFDGTAGDAITIVMSSSTFTPALVLYKPTGEIVAYPSGSSGQVTLTRTLEATGKWSVAAAGSNSTALGNYGISLQTPRCTPQTTLINHLRNPGFDQGTSSWKLGWETATWSAFDAGQKATSGSIEVTIVGIQPLPIVATQSVRVTPGARYTLGGSFYGWVPGASAIVAEFTTGVSGSGCAGQAISVELIRAQQWIQRRWEKVTKEIVAPASANCARIYPLLEPQPSIVDVARFDDLFFGNTSAAPEGFSTAGCVSTLRDMAVTFGGVNSGCGLPKACAQGEEVRFSATAVNFDRNLEVCGPVQWSFSDGVKLTGENVSRTFSSPGSFGVYWSSPAGASASASVVVAGPVAQYPNLLRNPDFTRDLSSWSVRLDGTMLAVADWHYRNGGSARQTYASTTRPDFAWHLLQEVDVLPLQPYTFGGRFWSDKIVDARQVPMVIGWKLPNGNYRREELVATPGVGAWTSASRSVTSPSEITKAVVFLEIPTFAGITWGYDDLFFAGPPGQTCAAPTANASIIYRGAASGCTESAGACRKSENISFTATTTGASFQSCDTLEWTFGDGGTATGSNSDHSYSSAGTYTVTLTVRNTAGSRQTTTTVRIPEEPACQRGDFDGDGAVSVFDASLVLKQVLTPASLNSRQLCAGDYDRDGSISVQDASLILQCVLRGSCS